MKWQIESAKNGQLTLKIEDYYLYSKYNPVNDVNKFIESETNLTMSAYLLIGIGLGYHLESILKITSNQSVYVYCLNKSEKDVFQQYGKINLLNNSRVKLIELKEIPSIISKNTTQLIFPLPWIKVVGENHPLFDSLLEIKTKQMSYSISLTNLMDNFWLNSTNNDETITTWKQYLSKKKACLVAAGPSLDENINLLKAIAENHFVISVGSALKALLANSIMPDAVIITDPSENVVKQIEGTHYKGPLFYLSTANYHMTTLYSYKRYIIFQKGFIESERHARDKKLPLLETGGSVATTALSLLEYMGTQEVYLFGQDLGFKNDKTHAVGSTSGVFMVKNRRYMTVRANNGELINTAPNLQAYQRWIERKSKKTSMKIYNTSLSGAEIDGVPFISGFDLLTKTGISKDDEND